MLRVYMAGPISNGGSEKMGYYQVMSNIREAVDVATFLADNGLSPFLPHLTHFWELMEPRPQRDWMQMDEAWIKVSDVLLRLDGESVGADKEVSVARTLHIPVYYDCLTLVQAVKDGKVRARYHA